MHPKKHTYTRLPGEGGKSIFTIATGQLDQLPSYSFLSQTRCGPTTGSLSRKLLNILWSTWQCFEKGSIQRDDANELHINLAVPCFGKRVLAKLVYSSGFIYSTYSLQWANPQHSLEHNRHMSCTLYIYECYICIVSCYLHRPRNFPGATIHKQPKQCRYKIPPFGNSTFRRQNFVSSKSLISIRGKWCNEVRGIEANFTSEIGSPKLTPDISDFTVSAAPNKGAPEVQPPNPISGPRTVHQ